MEPLRDGRERGTTATSSALALIGPVEHSFTPDTDPEETSDESTDENTSDNNYHGSSNRNDASDFGALTISVPRGDACKPPARGAAARKCADVEDDGRLYLTSDDDSTNGSTPTRRSGVLGITGRGDPVRALSITSPWNIQGTTTPGDLGSCSGFTTPMSTSYPSPLRSCPRSAISSKRERLNERTDAPNEPTRQQAPAALSAVPRWASSKTLGAAPARKEGLSPKDTAGASKKQQERIPRATKPLGSLKGSRLALPAPQRAGGVASGQGAGRANGVRLSRKPWAATAPGPIGANGPAVRLDALALQGHAKGRGSSPPRGSTGGGRASEVTIEVNVASKQSSTIGGFKRPSPALKDLLEAAAARSFDDVQSAFGSETDQSEGVGGLGTEVASSYGGGGESTPPLPARASSSAAPLGETENRLKVATRTFARSAELVRSEGTESIRPLSLPVWPPPRGVVAGVEEVQGVLESPNGGYGQQLQEGRHVRRHGSTGMAWGEDAKLALARKRLQWER